MQGPVVSQLCAKLVDCPFPCPLPASVHVCPVAPVLPLYPIAADTLHRILGQRSVRSGYNSGRWGFGYDSGVDSGWFSQIRKPGGTWSGPKYGRVQCVLVPAPCGMQIRSSAA